MSNFYVYLHTKADTLEPFYVGKGKGNRAFKPYSRNKYWQSIVKKHGFIAEILATWKTEQEAFDHEKLLISCFKDMGYKLANMTEGGEGSSGFIPTDEMRQKMSIAQKGKRLGDDNPMRKGDTAKRVADKIRGRSSPHKLDKTIYKFSHKIHGEVNCIKYELRVNYGVGKSCLTAICDGTRKSAKGWVCLGKV